MEIRSSSLPAYPVSRQPRARTEAVAPTNEQQQSQQQEERKEVNADKPLVRQQESTATDYRQLIRAARTSQGAESSEEEQPHEAYRIGGEPHRVQQALGAYRENEDLHSEGGDLMPRLDDYV